MKTEITFFDDSVTSKEKYILGEIEADSPPIPIVGQYITIQDNRGAICLGKVVDVVIHYHTLFYPDDKISVSVGIIPDRTAFNENLYP